MTRTGWRASTAGAAAVIAVLAACGGGSSSTQGGGSCTPGTSASVTISSAGVAPKAVCVQPGGTVTFHNNDTAAHQIQSTGTCTELNLPSIAAGQSDTAMFSTTGTCTYQDATQAGNAAFQGTVAVSAAPTTGPGY